MKFLCRICEDGYSGVIEKLSNNWLYGQMITPPVYGQGALDVSP